jgi:hypothetical protein
LLTRGRARLALSHESLPQIANFSRRLNRAKRAPLSVTRPRFDCTCLDLLAFLRNKQGRFFTLILPLHFFVIFVSVFGNDTLGAQHVKASTYYVPGLSALGLIAAFFVNLVISITAQRESGVLKRRRATPVPA